MRPRLSPRRPHSPSKLAPLYADYNATCPLSAGHWREVEKALSLAGLAPGNPSSLHDRGRQAKRLLEQARERVAAAVGVERGQVIFTSGATESNNWLVRAFGGSRAAVGADAHPALLAPVVADGGHVLPLGPDGCVQGDIAAWPSGVDLVGLIHVHNEIGTITDVAALTARLKAVRPGVHVHVDAVQSLGKLPLPALWAAGVDSFALSGHKIGALTGIGALVVRHPERLTPLFRGGGHERGLRAGTENLVGAVSLGLRVEAVTGAPSLGMAEALKGELVERLRQIPGAQIHGDPVQTVANTVHFSVADLPRDYLLLSLDRQGICVSGGSACSSGVAKPNPVVEALGFSRWRATHGVRVSFGVGNLAEDAERIATGVAQAAASQARNQVRDHRTVAK